MISSSRMMMTHEVTLSTLECSQTVPVWPMTQRQMLMRHLCVFGSMNLHISSCMCSVLSQLSCVLLVIAERSEACVVSVLSLSVVHTSVSSYWFQQRVFDESKASVCVKWIIFIFSLLWEDPIEVNSNSCEGGTVPPARVPSPVRKPQNTH